MPVYAILIQSDEGVELLSNYFNTYNDALAEVKRKFSDDWDDSLDEYGDVNEYRNNKVDVGEGHKMPRRAGSEDPASNDPNLTELYIEKGINIYIRKLVEKPKSVSGGYSRRRQRKGNTKSIKYRI